MNVMGFISGFLTIVGSLGIFLYGMKVMSEGLQKIAGDKMRLVLSRMTSKPLSGVLTGTLVTSVILSSSATTVMTVSFASAGLLSLSGAIAVVMGANIGTTITAWIISIFGLKLSIAALAIPIIAISLPFIFSNKDKLKNIGEFLVGFAFLFMGMEMLKNSIPDISAYPQVLEGIARFSGYGYLSVLIFVLIGTLCTVIVQSSSAMMAITIVMCAQGWIGFEAAAALVLGENIGTTITANIAASVANVNAKRVARSHFVFNVIGVIWMLVVFYPFLKGISFLTFKMEGADPYLSPAAIPVALSLFHTCFNIINTSILVWFIPFIERIVVRMVKEPEVMKENKQLSYISVGTLSTAELNLETARREIKVFSERVLKMYSFLRELPSKQGDEYKELSQRIAKYEEITDNMELEIAEFLKQVAAHSTSGETSQDVLCMLREIDNLESLGDGIFHLAKLEQSRREQGIVLGEEEQLNLRNIESKVEQALLLMDANLDLDDDKHDIDRAYRIEEDINACRDDLRSRHLAAVRDNRYSYTQGSLYSGAYALYEKLGDYIINVTEGIDDSRRHEDRQH